jgi:hypothetical protein
MPLQGVFLILLSRLNRKKRLRAITIKLSQLVCHDKPPAVDLRKLLTSATCHAVTRVESLTGFGKVPAATLRHKVAELKGKRAGYLGRLGSKTKCDSRRKALSGNSSNEGD